jgi:alkylation response protein AidB-like acyl-CoA dehydrogenase
MSTDNLNDTVNVGDARSAGADTIGAAMPIETEKHGQATELDALALLNTAHTVCEEVLGPNAQRADRAGGPLAENFQALANAGLLGIALPRRFGGLDAPGAVQRQYTETLASYCGVTTFVQAQHHGSSRMIANGPSELLKQTVVPDLAAGRRMCAISFAHLRRPGPPTLAAEKVSDGYRLNGTAPWVTGWGLMDQVVFGATLPDGRFVYLWSPGNRETFSSVFELTDPMDSRWGELTASPPIPLCAMNSSSTVALHLNNWFIPTEHFLAESDRETMARNDRNGVLGATAMPLGCASAALRILCDVADKKPFPAIQRAVSAFTSELSDARAQVDEWSSKGGEPEFFEPALQIRAWCIELAVRMSHAAITAVSGSANSLDHPAQRLMREAMFYTIQAQTREVMGATLERLERSPLRPNVQLERPLP